MFHLLNLTYSTILYLPYYLIALVKRTCLVFCRVYFDFKAALPQAMTIIESYSTRVVKCMRHVKTVRMVAS